MFSLPVGVFHPDYALLLGFVMRAVMASWIEVPGWSMRYCLITAGSGISPSGISVGRIREESADITRKKNKTNAKIYSPMIMFSRTATGRRAYPTY